MASDLGPLDQQVMLAIMRQQPKAYGVSIQELIEERTGREYSVGAIYASLDRLQDKGYVASKQGEPTSERGGRAKFYFHLTAPGRVALQQSLRALDDLRRGIRWAEVSA
jgi:PadR family transcriptional regulator PadR